MSKKLVMFDMDGVLFNTMPRHAHAWRLAFDEVGHHEPESAFYIHEGRNGRGTVHSVLGPDADWEAIYGRKSQIFASLPEGGLIPGAKRVVEMVRSAGIPAIVVTGSGQPTTLDRVGAEYPGLFRTEWMVTGMDVTRGKPDPEPYLTGLRKAGVNPEDAVVIENAPLGVMSGRAAGCLVVAVNTGPLPDQCLLDAGADYLFENMDELAARLDEILRR